MKKLVCLFIAIIMAVGLCACGSEKANTAAPDDVMNRADGEIPANAEPAESPSEGKEDAGEAVRDGGDDDFSYSKSSRDEGIRDAVADVAPADAYLGEGEVIGEPRIDDPGEVDVPTVPEIIEAGTLTAGEWKDNDHYDFWQEVLAREDWAGFIDLWKMNVTKRFVVTVSDGQNTTKNAAVALLDADGNVISRAVTDSYGKAYLYYAIDFSDKVPAAVAVGSDVHEISEDELAAGGATVAGSGERYLKLDLMFTTDTTGSMTDELAYLKKELGNVIERVSEENKGIDVRLSVNFYRDEGDEYVVRDFAFSGDIDEVLRELDKQFSDGGGDYPEAVHTALDNSVNGHDWREDAVKLLFLTLDAPGHSDVEGVPESVRASVTAAAEKGVRIIPIAASGVDTETEFMLRAMACATGGTYIFLTDHSGVGESHLEPTIGDYNVKKLNDLLVNVINEYCK